MLKCLIADDSKVIRMLLSKIMSNLGMEVMEAADGEEAVEMFKTQQPDLMIMDINLPVMDGMDVVLVVKDTPDVKQPKIILCSLIKDINRIKKALEEGVDDYIMKPFDEEIITSKLSILGMI